MYSRSPTAASNKKGIYDGVYSAAPPSEWLTPRVVSNSKHRSSSDAANTEFVSRNLMMDKSFSEPSSPHLKHKGTGSATHKNKIITTGDYARLHSKPPKPVRQVFNSSSSSEDIQITKQRLCKQTSEGTELAEFLASQQEKKLQKMNAMGGRGGNTSMTKWGSWSGITDNSKGDYSNEVISSSYGKSLSPVHYPMSSEGPQRWGDNGFTSSGSSASVAYVAPQLRKDTTPYDDYAIPSAPLSRPKTPSSMSSSTDDDRLDSLIKAKDELIRQKDQIIDRQKKSIEQLQQHQLSVDAKLHNMLLSKSCGEEGVVTVKLQEYQLEVAQLRAHLAQIMVAKDAEIEQLQRKLGESEYFLEQMRAFVNDAAMTKDKDAEDSQHKLASKDQSIVELHKQLETSKQELLNSKRRVDSLERYLSDVPTVEEHQKTLKNLKDIRDERSKLQETLSNKDKKLAQMNKAYGSKSDDLKKIHKQNKALKEKVESQEKYLEKFKNNGAVSEIEFEDMKMENERLQAELNRTKKVLEGKHKKMKALHDQSQKDHKALEERLAQEEGAVLALRDEINTRDKRTTELRTSIKQMAAQMQDLMEQNLNLKSACEKYEKLNSREKAEASQRLWKELSRCLSDLKAVVQLCTARKDGQDPNMSLLFGVKGNTTVLEEFTDLGDDVNSLNQRILKIHEIQTEIDALRTFITDQYAEDVGNNCTTQ